jgi:hypothetical protein
VPVSSIMRIIIQCHRSILAAAVLVWLFCPSAARCAPIEWTNENSGDWSAVTNWSPQQVPTSADDVTLNIGVTVTVDVPAFANSVGIAGLVILDGPGPLTISGPLN